MCRKHVPLAAAILALLFMSAACSSESPTGPEPPSGEPVTFQTLVEKENALPVQGQYGGYDFTEPENLVLRNVDDFARFWEVLYGNMTSPPERPAVDFSENVVVAVMQGVQPSGGYTIAVEDVTAHGGSMRVSVEATIPGSTCLTTQAITTPYQIVEINRPATGEVAFSSTEAVHTCGS